MTKRLDSFPTDIVKDLTKSFNKAFHSKVFTLIASSESEIYSITQLFEKHYDACFSFVKDEEGQWYMDKKKVEEIRNWIIKQDFEDIIKLHKQWQGYWNDYLQLIKGINLDNLRKLFNKDFYQLFEKFYIQYILVGSLAYLTDCFMSTGEKDWLEEQIGKEVKDKNKLRTLTSPVHLSFTLEAEYQLLKAAVDLSKGKNINEKLKELEHNFHWIQNNYHNVHYVTEKEFNEKVKKIIAEHSDIEFLLKEKEEHLTKIKIEREEVVNSLGLSDHTRNVLKIARLFTKWKDVRKSGVYIGMYYFDLFLEEVAKRTDYNKEELTFAVFNEIQGILNGDNIHEELAKRKKQCFFAVTTEGYFICGEKDAEKYFALTKQASNQNITELRGVVACTGYACGRVRIIRKTSEMKDFQTGEILVTNQTTPEFVPIIKKAAAIITEQGGITSHAAIVSRELKVPCIIGTKIATTALMNGENVEVDANNGIIRRLR